MNLWDAKKGIKSMVKDELKSQRAYLVQQMKIECFSEYETPFGTVLLLLYSGRLLTCVLYFFLDFFKEMDNLADTDPDKTEFNRHDLLRCVVKSIQTTGNDWLYKHLNPA